MKRSAILSRCNRLFDHGILLVVLAGALLYAKQYRLTVFALCVIAYALVSNDNTWIFAALLLGLYLIPYPAFHTSIHEGRVIAVKENYAIVQSGCTRVLVYTKALPVLDSWIAFDGEETEIVSSKGFCRFDFASWCARQGITKSVTPDSITEIRKTHSLRGLLMDHVLKNHPETGRELLAVLLNIRSEDSFHGLFQERGFSLAGLIALFEVIAKYFLPREERKKIRFGLTFFLAVLFHFPYLLTQRLIYGLLEKAGLEGTNKTALGLLIGLRLFPHVITSASFLIPALYAFSAKRSEEKTLQRLLTGMHLSSLLYQSANPMELLLYPVFLPLSGLSWILAFLEAALGMNLLGLIHLIDRLFSWVSFFDLPGTILGFGLLAYLPMTVLVKKGKYQLQMRLLLFLFFQFFGLFHPLAELSMINVGQGDAILLRGPFGTSDILVDTGKPSQKNNLFSFLEAKGIRKLEAMIISHSDNDHSGNAEEVIEEFHPSFVLTEHHEPVTVEFLRLYDLNDVSSDNANASSIVTYVRLNGMDILLTGDIDQETEERIVKRYPGLNVDILKLSHHGSDTGSSPKFLDALCPKLALVSSGVFSIYHHPSPAVIDRLNSRRIPYLDTKEEGDISIFCFPGFNVLLTASGKIAIIRV
ncbi:MAG: MBL fold metallo-hydrolase [Solobacterium sp.]|nr:MBL fold metallo-hydrolase [Solobacterium sp.]